MNVSVLGPEMHLQTVEPIIAETISLREEPTPTKVVEEFLTVRRFALLLLLLVLATFPEVVFSAKTFYFRDYSFFGFPLAHYHREAFWRGEIPLWNPLNNCGIPYVAQWNTMVFYPLSLIYLLLPLPWSLGWFCLLHLFLAGLGMYQLAFRCTNDRLAASVAGMAFAFSGFTLGCLIWPNNIAALGWLPWVLLTGEKALREGGGEVIKASLVGAMQMLSGAPEVILFTWMLMGAVALVALCAAREKRWKIIAHSGVIIVLVAALSAIQLLPFLDLLGHSQRGGQSYNSYWSIPPWGWANFLVPLFRTGKTSAGVFLQPTQGWISSYHLGIAPLLLALAALWRVRRPIIWLAGVVLGGSAILALGESGYLLPWLQKVVPQLGFMRYPVKILILAAAIVPILAAFAIADARKSKPGPQVGFFRTTVLAAAVCLSLIVAIILYSWYFPGTDEDSRATMWNGIGRAAVLVIFVGIVYLNQRGCAAGSVQNAICQLALAAAIWGDLISHAPNQNPTVAATAYEIDLPTFPAMDPRPGIGKSRALLSLRTIDKFHTTIVSNGFDTVVGARMGLYDNCNLLEGIPKIDGFYSLYLPEEQQVRFRIYAGSNSVCSPIADFLGVSQVSSERSFLDWENRPTWMPMITSGQRPEFATATQILDGVLSDKFEPRRTVFLPREAQSEITANEGATANILSQSCSAHRIGVDVTAERASLLVIAQSFYHWWQARIDGQPAKLWRANHAFQALEVPAGRHQVELTYEDQSFRIGRSISCATFIGCAGFLMVRRKAARNHPSELA